MQKKRISYIELPPHPILADYIKTYWYFRYNENEVQPFDIMPDGYFDLLISIKDGCVKSSRLVGIWTKMVTVSYTNSETIGIQFKPQALASLLDIRIKELLDDSVSFDLQQYHIDKSFLEDKVTIDLNAIKHYFDDLFLPLLNTTNMDKRMDSLFHLLEVSSGIISVETISKAIGLSTRQMHRKANELIGIGVKDYAKIIRFKKALSLIREDKSNYDGYFDQSHFIKNFKAYTGLTPSEIDFGNNVRFLQYYDFIDK